MKSNIWQQVLEVFVKTKSMVAVPKQTVSLTNSNSIRGVLETSLSESELKNALSILSMKQNQKKLLLQSLSQDLSSLETRTKHINKLTSVMNELNLPKDKNLPLLQKDHFNKIVDGLTLISNNKFNDMTSISLKDLTKLINNINSEQELLHLFDTFYFTGKLTLKIAIEILLNKNLTNIEKITTRILHSGKNKYIKWSQKNYNDFELSILQKNYQYKKYDKIKELLQFYQNNQYWQQCIRNNRVSNFSERTLWKFSMMFESLEENFNILQKLNNDKSRWLFLESFYFYSKSVKSIHRFDKILSYIGKTLKLTREQEILYKFLSNELVQNSTEEINSILNISLLANASSTTISFNSRKTIIRELTRKLYYLQQKYEDFDLTALNNDLNEFMKFENELLIEEIDKNNKVMELGRLFEF